MLQPSNATVGGKRSPYLAKVQNAMPDALPADEPNPEPQHPDQVLIERIADGARASDSLIEILRFAVTQVCKVASSAGIDVSKEVGIAPEHVGSIIDQEAKVKTLIACLRELANKLGSATLSSVPWDSLNQALIQPLCDRIKGGTAAAEELSEMSRHAMPDPLPADDLNNTPKHPDQILIECIADGACASDSLIEILRFAVTQVCKVASSAGIDVSKEVGIAPEHVGSIIHQEAKVKALIACLRGLANKLGNATLSSVPWDSLNQALIQPLCVRIKLGTLAAEELCGKYCLEPTSATLKKMNSTQRYYEYLRFEARCVVMMRIIHGIRTRKKFINNMGQQIPGKDFARYFHGGVEKEFPRVKKREEGVLRPPRDQDAAPPDPNLVPPVNPGHVIGPNARPTPRELHSDEIGKKPKTTDVTQIPDTSPGGRDKLIEQVIEQEEQNRKVERARELGKVLARLIDQLPEDLPRWMKLILDPKRRLTYREIAVIQQCSTGTITNRRKKALVLLAKNSEVQDLLQANSFNEAFDELKVLLKAYLELKDFRPEFPAWFFDSIDEQNDTDDQESKEK